jgi:hypothetical protein
MSFHHATYLNDGDEKRIERIATPRLPRRQLPAKMIDCDGVRFCVVCGFKRVMTPTEKECAKHKSLYRLSDMTPILSCENHKTPQVIAAYRRNLHLICVDKDMVGYGVQAIKNTIRRIELQILYVKGRITYGERQAHV